MMKRIKIGLMFGVSILLIRCGTPSSGSPESGGITNHQNYLGDSWAGTGEPEIPFKGGVIHLEEEGSFNIQEIAKEKGDVKFTAQRIPTELYLQNQGLNGDKLQAALTETKGEQLFYFEFEEKQRQDLLKKYYSDNMDVGVSYMSFDIAEDFYLVSESGDTISADYSLYERNFHVAPYERIILSFSGIDQKEEVRLLYHDKLFGKGNLDFAFASSLYLERNIKNPS